MEIYGNIVRVHASFIENHQIVISNWVFGAKHQCNPMAVAPAPGSYDPSDGTLEPFAGVG